MHHQGEVSERHLLPIVGVMGSGTDEHIERSRLMGRWLARRGVHLLTGGGRGVMAAVSRAFYETLERRGLVIGVIPGDLDAPVLPEGYPNPWVEIPVRTHLPYSGARGTDPLSRNHINILTADVVVALPGGSGTASEVTLAQRYNKPLVAFVDSTSDIPGLSTDVVRTDFDGVVQFVNHVLEQCETVR